MAGYLPWMLSTEKFGQAILLLELMVNNTHQISYACLPSFRNPKLMWMQPKMVQYKIVRNWMVMLGYLRTYNQCQRLKLKKVLVMLRMNHERKFHSPGHWVFLHLVALHGPKDHRRIVLLLGHGPDLAQEASFLLRPIRTVRPKLKRMLASGSCLAET